MSSDTTAVERPLEAYKSDEKPTWCPGCGDFGVLNALYTALKAKQYDPKDVVIVSGIGCSSRLPFFVSTYGFHGVHGRAMPIATGVKVARPELHVLAMGGDGDAFAIGGGHFIHAARRNLDITYVIMDNAVYGLTKGQAAPTAQLGYKPKIMPETADRPINPLVMALASGATFVARAFSGRPKELADLIVQGIDHRGFAFIDTFSPCPTFNKVNTFQSYREAVAPLPPDHDPSDWHAAMRLATSEAPTYLGVFYRSEREVPFEEHHERAKTGTPADTRKVLESLFDRYS